MQHNKIPDLEASILKDICKYVKIEPELLPIGNNAVASSNTSEKARLGVAAVSCPSLLNWTIFFCDVRDDLPDRIHHLRITFCTISVYTSVEE